jgi:hypothetical protein
MNTVSDIQKFLLDLIDVKTASKQNICASWLVTEVLQNNSKIDGYDMPFYKLCASKFVYDLAKKSISKYTEMIESSEQMTIVGFEKLKTHYSVIRGKEIWLVDINALTNEELEKRACEYEAMAVGCNLHAKEIRDFIAQRYSQLKAG